MIRTLKSQALSSTSIDVTTTGPPLPGFVRHAGWLLSHYAVGFDDVDPTKANLDQPQKMRRNNTNNTIANAIQVSIDIPGSSSASNPSTDVEQHGASTAVKRANGQEHSGTRSEEDAN